jgi:hypothetical protein
MFIFSTLELVRHLQQLNTVFFLRWCLIQAVLLQQTKEHFNCHAECNGTGVLFTCH